MPGRNRPGPARRRGDRRRGRLRSDRGRRARPRRVAPGLLELASKSCMAFIESLWSRQSSCSVAECTAHPQACGGRELPGGGARSAAERAGVHGVCGGPAGGGGRVQHGLGRVWRAGWLVPPKCMLGLRPRSSSCMCCACLAFCQHAVCLACSRVLSLPVMLAHSPDPPAQSRPWRPRVLDLRVL